MSFWKNKNVLITGSSGFVGTHLQRKLSSLGACVIGVSRHTRNKQTRIVDITDFKKINSLIKKEKIDICFHLASESLVESGQSEPYNTFKTNIEGTLNILECARINKLARIIIASTSHVYGNAKPPFVEFYPPKPSRPYETSKTCTDLIAQSYANTFGLPVLIPRFVNIYGPGDLNFNRLIPKTLKNVLNNKSPEMWGGNAKRDYLYIDDVINAYIMLAEIDLKKIGNNRIFNFGSDNVLSVKEIIEKIIYYTNSKFKIKKIKNERELEIKIQFSSWKKANRLLGWKPDNSIDSGFAKTVDWYREYFSE